MGSGATLLRLTHVIVVALLFVGSCVRFLPLLEGDTLLLRRPTEDGYLMLTVSRNLAIGLGMSTAEGTIPTNGVQPLAAGLFALCFWVAGGDKANGVALVMWLSFLLAVLAAFAVYRLARVLFRERDHAPTLSALVAALWFASPVVLSHSMNALETGLCFLTTALTLTYFFQHAPDGRTPLLFKRAVTLGALLGLGFWARNDSVFLAAAIVVARLTPAVAGPLPVLGKRVRELALVGLTTLVVASPWMISNKLRFGSVVPISGGAQSLGAAVGNNLKELPSKLVEMFSVVGAIPQSLETRTSVVLACWLLVGLALVAAVLVFRQAGPATRNALVTGGVHAGLLAFYYGLFFGAPHFLSRYLSPASILIAIFMVGLLADQARRWNVIRIAVPVAALLAVGLDGRLYAKRYEHMHFQVVDWVRDHVLPDTWVGAVQTGTLGFFHDRTINLDGKTNPEALAARKANRMRTYIVDSRIDYIVDWSGLASWKEWLAPDFELLLHDPQQNISVFKRIRRS